jgi:hypothetical protein
VTAIAARGIEDVRRRLAADEAHRTERERFGVFVALEGRIRLQIELVEETIPISHRTRRGHEVVSMIADETAVRPSALRDTADALPFKGRAPERLALADHPTTGLPASRVQD